jgi:hypothetical protein
VGAKLLVAAGRPETITECIEMSPAEVNVLLGSRTADAPRSTDADAAMRRALAEISADPDRFWETAFATVHARTGMRREAAEDF